jgi:hypothetical protein
MEISFLEMAADYVSHTSRKLKKRTPQLGKNERKKFHSGVLGNRHPRSIYAVSGFFEFPELAVHT